MVKFLPTNLGYNSFFTKEIKFFLRIARFESLSGATGKWAN